MKVNILYISILLASISNANISKVSKSEDLSLTIYNNNIAMVNDKREVNFKSNKKQKLLYEGIASSVIHESIIPTFTAPTTLYSQNYHYDVLSLHKLLEKSINTMVTYKVQIEDYKYKKQKALLLSLNPIMLKKDNEIISDVKNTDIIFSKIPEDLIVKPSLVWNLKPSIGKQKIKLNYLTRNITWKSDYILNIDEKNTLNAWISIKNNSGVSYENANIYCIAGDVKKDKPKVYRKNVRMMESVMMSDSPIIKEKSFAGYHLYKIPFKETLQNNENKQINFINKDDIKIKSIAKSSNNMYMHRFNKINASKFKHMINFKNSKESGLGIALPKGTVRVYKKDEEISHFIGQDDLGHTSINEEISLHIGNFFDISQKISQTKFKPTKYNVQSAYTRVIENKTNKKQTIKIVEKSTLHNIKDLTNQNNCKDNCTVEKSDLYSYTYTIKMQPFSKYDLKTSYTLEYARSLK